MSKTTNTTNKKNVVTCYINGKDYYINSSNFVEEITKATRKAGILGEFKVYVNGKSVKEKEASQIKVSPHDRISVRPYVGMFG